MPKKRASEHFSRFFCSIHEQIALYKCALLRLEHRAMFIFRKKRNHPSSKREKCFLVCTNGAARLQIMF